MNEKIKNKWDIQELLYQKVPALIEKLDTCTPEQALLIAQALREIAAMGE